MTKLYRSRADSKLFGLCGGLAQMINVDSTLLRVIVVVTAFFSGGTVIPLYFIACLVIPKEPVFDFPSSHTHGPYYGNSSTPNNGAGSYGQGVRPGYYNTQGYQGPQDPQGSTPPGFTQGFSQGTAPTRPIPPQESTIDEMMRDMEKKMLQREIDELRAKVAQYEQQRNRPKGNEEGQ